MNGANRSPIALFVYNRPEHTRQTLLALQSCAGFESSLLFIFCDGAKSADDKEVEAVRRVVRELAGDATIIEADSNLGLAASIIAGVTRLCDEYERVIVLEDDLVVAEGFLEYMNTALDRYADCETVMQISGHMFDVPEFEGMKEAMFLPLTTSWGWGTWKRAWAHFDATASGVEMLADPAIEARFNLDGAFDYHAMLRRQLAGKSDSWAIRWYWSVFKLDGLVLFPPRSLIDNRGFDGSGTHGWRAARRAHRELTLYGDRVEFPTEVHINKAGLEAVRRAMLRMSRGRLRKIADRAFSIFR